MNDKDMARLRAETNYDFGPLVSTLFQNIGQAFRVLHRIQYGQPWDRAPRHPTSAACR